MSTTTQFPAAPRFILLSVVMLMAMLLSACAERTVWAPEEAIMAARHVHGGQPELTLVTIMNYRTGRGDHTGLIINASERVLFDPSGRWTIDTVPERHYVHFGMTPTAGASYFLSHTRDTHYTVVKRLPVSAEVAEQALQLAKANGPVPPARCAITVSTLLQQLEGFESIQRSWFPHNVKRDFLALPGVQRHDLHHDDPALEQLARQVQRPL